MKVDYYRELEKVLEIVRSHPRGCTIKEVSEEIGINRNAVAKYLDVLQVAGQVEMRRVGPAKVYFPSRSVPISRLFDFSEDFLVIIDEGLLTVEVNMPFLRYVNIMNKEEIVGKPVTELPLIGSFPEVMENIKRVLKDHRVIEDKLVYNKEDESQPEGFLAKFIPTTFNDGKKGVALMIRKL